MQKQIPQRSTFKDFYSTYTRLLLTYIFENIPNAKHPIKSLAFGITSSSDMLSNQEILEAESNFPDFIKELKKIAVLLIETIKEANLPFDQANELIQKIINIALEKETALLSDAELTKHLEILNANRTSLEPHKNILQSLLNDFSNNCVETACQLIQDRNQKLEEAKQTLKETLGISNIIREEDTLRASNMTKEELWIEIKKLQGAHYLPNDGSISDNADPYALILWYLVGSAKAHDFTE